MEIITNNHERPLLDWFELTDKEREWFDWEGADEGSFFRYRGEAYSLGEFLATDIPGWDGFHADSFFSGIAVKLSDDYEFVVAALVLA